MGPIFENKDQLVLAMLEMFYFNICAYSISPPNEHTILVPVPMACTSVKFTQSVWNFHSM